MENDGETVREFLILGSKITADGECSHEIKRRLHLGRKATTNLDSILKSRDITLLTKVRLAKAIVFPVVMHGCESWTIKKAEHGRIDAFELRCWRRLLRVPWTARNLTSQSWRKSVLNIHWKDWCWSWNSNTSATWCEELTHWKRLWCWARLKAGREGDDRGWDGCMASPTQWIWVWASSGSWWWTGKPGVLQSVGSQKVRHDWVTELKWRDHILFNHSSSTVVSRILFVHHKHPLYSEWMDIDQVFRVSSKILISIDKPLQYW